VQPGEEEAEQHQISASKVVESAGKTRKETTHSISNELVPHTDAIRGIFIQFISNLIGESCRNKRGKERLVELQQKTEYGEAMATL